MIKEIEKEFFEVFGIKPEEITNCDLCTYGYSMTCPADNDAKSCVNFHEEYPEITAEIMLRLEAMLLKNRFNLVASFKMQRSLGGTFVYNFYLGGQGIHFCSNKGTRTESLLSLFIKIANRDVVKNTGKERHIQGINKLADDIKPEVQKLFEVNND